MKLHTLSPKDALKALESSENGLSEQEVRKRHTTFGYNELTEKKPRSLLSRFAEQFSDFMILILLGAALISFLSSLLEGKADFAEPLIILTIVVINAVLGVMQEAKAERSLAMLRKLSAPEAFTTRSAQPFFAKKGSVTRNSRLAPKSARCRTVPIPEIILVLQLNSSTRTPPFRQ